MKFEESKVEVDSAPNIRKVNNINLGYEGENDLDDG
jgi:hypothetical protein